MDDHREILRKQAEWQRAQADLSWPAKVRWVEIVRESIVRLRRPPMRAPEPPRPPDKSEQDKKAWFADVLYASQNVQSTAGQVGALRLWLASPLQALQPLHVGLVLWSANRSLVGQQLT